MMARSWRMWPYVCRGLGLSCSDGDGDVMVISGRVFLHVVFV